MHIYKSGDPNDAVVLIDQQSAAIDLGVQHERMQLEMLGVRLDEHYHEDMHNLLNKVGDIDEVLKGDRTELIKYLSMKQDYEKKYGKYK